MKSAIDLHVDVIKWTVGHGNKKLKIAILGTHLIYTPNIWFCMSQVRPNDNMCEDNHWNNK